MTDTVAIIGCGLIGRAWAISFARGGRNVRLFDPAQGVATKAVELISHTLMEMAGYDLLNGQEPSDIMARLSIAETMPEAVVGVVHVQENAPERADAKKELFSQLDTLVPPTAVIASSTSAILPSVFTGHITTRERCLVAHPLNPPHLIPAVEVVPAPWTSPDALERTRLLMLDIGQHPLMMTKEIDGFLMNRLQGALAEECFRLVESGIVSVDDIDAGVRNGLALRWCFIGPFETMDLNAPGGITDYVKRYDAGLARQFETQKHRVNWFGPALTKIEAARRKHFPVDGVARRQNWRDRRLMALVAHKKKASVDIGD
jgi:L-gulonate 3-dehydrogenase